MLFLLYSSLTIGVAMGSWVFLEIFKIYMTQTQIFQVGSEIATLLTSSLSIHDYFYLFSKHSLTAFSV